MANHKKSFPSWVTKREKGKICKPIQNNKQETSTTAQGCTQQSSQQGQTANNKLPKAANNRPAAAKLPKDKQKQPNCNTNLPNKPNITATIKQQ